MVKPTSSFPNLFSSALRKQNRSILVFRKSSLSKRFVMPPIINSNVSLEISVNNSENFKSNNFIFYLQYLFIALHNVVTWRDKTLYPGHYDIHSFSTSYIIHIAQTLSGLPDVIEIWLIYNMTALIRSTFVLIFCITNRLPGSPTPSFNRIYL